MQSVEYPLRGIENHEGLKYSTQDRYIAINHGDVVKKFLDFADSCSPTFSTVIFIDLMDAAKY